MLALDSIVKYYGSVVALGGAGLSAVAGEVHGLLGPNGSGKSTINKILAGSVRPDGGTIRLDGQVVRIGSPRAADRLGIGAVYQQLTVIPDLTVGQNLVLGREPARAGFLAERTARRAAGDMLDRLRLGLGPAVQLDTPLAHLDPGQRQLIEIGKVLLRNPRILILDEATASLRREQVDLLFGIVREQQADGVAVIFVSHRLDEIMALCDRATILRSGKTVDTVTIADTTPDDLVHLMVGSTLESVTRTPSVAREEVMLEVDDLHGARLDGVTFSARAGEIVGLGGLQGQGQSELLLALFGAIGHTGTIRAAGRDLVHHSTTKSARGGIALVPGDRSSQGMFTIRPIQENLSIVSLWRRLVAGFALSARREQSVARRAVEQLAIKIGSLADPMSSLSGGNAQKVIVAKWLLNDPQIVLLDDPTKGVDVGAKAEIYAIARELAKAGVTIVINSSEDRELVTLCDRVLVLFEGRVVAELAGDGITEDALVAAALRVPKATP